jgi:hypothetical protein
MAAGVIQTTNNGRFNVDSSSCHDAIKALTSVQANHSFAGCLADPVVAGTKITFGYPGGFAQREFIIASTTATANGAAGLGSNAADFQSPELLLQALLVAFAVYMIFRGYDSGLKQ